MGGDAVKNRHIFPFQRSCLLDFVLQLLLYLIQLSTCSRAVEIVTADYLSTYRVNITVLA